MTCGFCKYNDGCTYTSLPPRFKCTITGEFHFGNDNCNVDFKPVRHGKWLRMEDYFKCSVCGDVYQTMTEYDIFPNVDFIYCPNCGAKMEV